MGLEICYIHELEAILAIACPITLTAVLKLQMLPEVAENHQVDREHQQFEQREFMS